jgi:hypothetical protein
MKKSKYMVGGGKTSKYKAAGGMKTEVGKEAKTQSYKEYVQKMFGGGMTEPAMKKKKTKGMARGGKFRMPTTGPSKISLRPNSSRPIDPVLPRGKKSKGDI